MWSSCEQGNDRRTCGTLLVPSEPRCSMFMPTASQDPICQCSQNAARRQPIKNGRQAVLLLVGFGREATLENPCTLACFLLAVPPAAHPSLPALKKVPSFVCFGMLSEPAGVQSHFFFPRCAGTQSQHTNLFHHFLLSLSATLHTYHRSDRAKICFMRHNARQHQLSEDLCHFSRPNDSLDSDVVKLASFSLV